MYAKPQIVRMLNKLKRLEGMLHDRMFVKVGQVDMKAWATMEPLHSIPDRGLFEPCEKGSRWEQEGLYCWFEGCYEVPEHLAGKKLFIFPHIKGYEGFLWVNGRPYGNFTTKISMGAHGNHYCDLLTQGAAAGEKLDIVLEYYAHHQVMGVDAFENCNEFFEIRYDDVDICLKDELIYNFYFDLCIANQMAECLREDDSRKADVIRTLVQIHGMIDYDIELADPEQWRATVREAGLLLQRLLQDKNGPHVTYLGVTGHSHMDTACFGM